MTFIQFLDNSIVHGSSINTSVLVFQGVSYPILFFSMMTERLKAQGIFLEIIDLSDVDISVFESKIHTSFLGMPLFLWLKDSSQLPDKKKKWLFNLVSDYQGPHTIAFFSSVDVPLNNKSVTISLPEQVDQKTITSLLSFLGKDASSGAKHVMTMCKGKDGIGVDSLCLLFHYAQLLGANNDSFMEEWFNKIIAADVSLFTLSTYFFAKKSKQFFQLLAHIGPQYSEIFWVSYWSEAVWKAHYYIAFTKAKQFSEAKKISTRLPFNFIQRDWKLHSPESLKKAHQHLYEIDFSLKNGGSQGMLDLFYSRYFAPSQLK